MKAIRSMMTLAPLAAGALVAPLHAADPTPQEIYTRLAAPEPSAAMAPEKRAAVLPSLALVPANADFVLALPTAGATSLELMSLLGEKDIPAALEKGVGSIHDAVLVAGSGSAAALERALPILSLASQLETMQQCQAWWCERAMPAYAPIIRECFEQQMAQGKAGVLEALGQFHLAPVYYALTAEHGHETDFADMHSQLVQGMRAAAEQDPELRFQESNGYAGLRISQLHAYRCLMKKEPQDPDIRRALAQRELYLYTKREGNAAIFILCEQPGDIELPAELSYSMLYSPKLSGADAHIDHLRATAWVSTAFNRTMRDCCRRDRFPAAQAIVDALRKIGAQDSANQQMYNEAAQALTWLVWQQPTSFEDIRTPLTVQVWQQGELLGIESRSDAQGMRFEPGKLGLIAQSSAPETLFYMESTAFSAPHTPDYSQYWGHLWQSVLSAAQGITLSLKEEHRDDIAPYIQGVGLLLPEIKSLGAAVHTMSGALAAPFAIISAQGKAPEDAADWAFCAAVKNRPALAEGWKQLLTAAGHTLGKLGLPPMLVAMLPVSTEPLGGSAVSHALDLPFGKGKQLPRVALSDTRFVLGDAESLNTRILTARSSEMPFSGAVSFADIPRLATAVHRAQVPDCCTDKKEKFAAFLDRLAARVKSLWSASTITDGVRTARGLMQLKK